MFVISKDTNCALIVLSRLGPKRVHKCSWKYGGTIIEVGVLRESKVSLVPGVRRFLGCVMTEEPENV